MGPTLRDEGSSPQLCQRGVANPCQVTKQSSIARVSAWRRIGSDQIDKVFQDQAVVSHDHRVVRMQSNQSASTAKITLLQGVQAHTGQGLGHGKHSNTCSREGGGEGEEMGGGKGGRGGVYHAVLAKELNGLDGILPSTALLIDARQVGLVVMCRL